MSYYLEEFQARFPGVPTMDDDRCLCDGCRVAYVRDVVSGEASSLCECGCYGSASDERVEGSGTAAVEPGICDCPSTRTTSASRVAAPAPGMSSYELADHIQALTLRARERIMGVGMRQYDDGIAGQRFESYTVERLLNELQDELLDVINYVGMLSIMVERAVTTTLREGSSDME